MPLFRPSERTLADTKGGRMTHIRPLQAHQSIEFGRKQSKALLSELRAGDPGALERAGPRQPDDWTLGSPANGRSLTPADRSPRVRPAELAATGRVPQ